MAYVLKDKIKISRPIVFLCGPYYNDSDKSDRRKILKDFFFAQFPNRCMPLIIDDFLTKENIGDDSISIQLLEEIFAGISHRTYIFLDTMSSAVELGLFTNSACNNSIHVFIPCEKERNCGAIGVFTRDVVLEDNAERVKTVAYHPRIERVALSTDYVCEYYKFIRDQLPTVLADDILEDYGKGLKPEYTIQLLCSDSYPKQDYSIHYQYNKEEDSLVIFISVKLLFYIVSGIVYAEYAKNLTNKKGLDFNHYNIDNAVSHLKSILIAFVLKNTFLGVSGRTKVDIQTVLAKDIEDIVKHIVTFIFIYHRKSRLKGYFLVRKNQIIKELDLKVNPTELFGLGAEDVDFLHKVWEESPECFRTFEIRTGHKNRQLVTYNEEEYGQNMRRLHEKVSKALYKGHRFSSHSFAYQKGKSVGSCAMRHRDSVSFLKFDIHDFFHSVNKIKLLKKVMQEFDVDAVYKEQMTGILDTCFYNGEMPLGLVPSPVLSDIYMKEFDDAVLQGLESRYVYTRYADDILISSTDVISAKEEKDIQALLEKLLGALKMKLNDKKYMRRDFRREGDFIKYLGLNIVKGSSGNSITVGKAYKNYIAKCYLNYMQMAETDEGGKKYYLGKQIAGYLGFVKMIEGEEGLKKIYKRIEKSTEGRVVIRDRIPNL